MSVSCTSSSSSPQPAKVLALRSSHDPFFKDLSQFFYRHLEPLYGDLKEEFYKTQDLNLRMVDVVLDARGLAGFLTARSHLETYMKEEKPQKIYELKHLGIFSSKEAGLYTAQNLVGQAKKNALYVGADRIEVVCSSLDCLFHDVLLKEGFTEQSSWQSKAVPQAKKHLLSYSFEKKEASLHQNQGLKRKREESEKEHNTVDPRVKKKARFDETKAATSSQFELTLKPQYIAQINSGKKTIEGRIHHGIVLKFKKGDGLKLFNPKKPQEKALCRIKEIKKYSSFKQMLEQEGVEKCLPGLKSLDEGVAIYDSLPGYKERAQKHGVAAIHIEKDDEHNS